MDHTQNLYSKFIHCLLKGKKKIIILLQLPYMYEITMIILLDQICYPFGPDLCVERTQNSVSLII